MTCNQLNMCLLCKNSVYTIQKQEIKAYKNEHRISAPYFYLISHSTIKILVFAFFKNVRLFQSYGGKSLSLVCQTGSGQGIKNTANKFFSIISNAQKNIKNGNVIMMIMLVYYFHLLDSLRLSLYFFFYSSVSLNN